MSEPAAFQASYSDWKVIKGRKVVQVVFELPLENADLAYQALGGMPIAASEVWCAIARLTDEARQQGSPHPRPPVAASPQPDAPPRAGGDKLRRTFGELSPAQQAGMLANDRAFRLFLAEKFDMPIPDPDEAASVIRHHCGVSSRAHITPDNGQWSALILAYRLWQREPEAVG